MSRRFPTVLYVTLERPENGDPYFFVHENGVADIEQDGEPVATYQLTDVGKVEIRKTLRNRKGKR